MWFELRWGITGCLLLTVALITTVFYNHPSTSNVTIFFRTVSILPETNGRVAEIFVGASEPVAKGTLIFGWIVQNGRQRSSRHGARLRRRKRKYWWRGGTWSKPMASFARPIASVSRRWTNSRQSRSSISATRATFHFARSSACRNASEGSSARSTRRPRRNKASKQRISTLLPAEKATAEAELAEAQVELGKTVIRAGVSGRVEQFLLRVGAVVNPLAFPAGILIPEGAGYRSLQAGFGQIEAQIMKVGMAAEVTCVSKPFTIIPMVVTGVQDYIAAGQFRGGEQLIDAAAVARPDTLLVFLRQMLSRRICFPSHMAQKLVHLFAREPAKASKAIRRVGFRVFDEAAAPCSHRQLALLRPN